MCEEESEREKGCRKQAVGEIIFMNEYDQSYTYTARELPRESWKRTREREKRKMKRKERR